MKRYVCAVATGLLLALLSTGTATASLPLLGETGTQVTSFGDQTVGEQKNDADVTQKQGNGNLNIAPAIGLFGDAETTNAQGNGNTATADVDQSNSVDQSQSSEQKQSLDQSDGSCCGGQSQTGEQKVYGGDQSVDEQKNDADVSQYQGNGNVNIAPAIAIFGDAESTNYQGNGNDADATVTQSNEATQAQSSEQKQWLDQDGGSCCDGQSQTGEQKTSFGDQYVGKQKNDADVNQFQGNGNVNVSPAIAIFGDATTKNAQGNGNTATADVDQSNSVDQSQSSKQKQSLEQSGGRKCCAGRSQTGEQKVYGGDQSVDEQKNDADVSQYQGNGNVNIAPAIAIFGDAESTNYQGNGNDADATVTQSNEATQAQSSEQKQWLDQDGGSCCDGQSQTGEQKTSFGDQYVGKQKNDADVNQFQGNGNVNVSPAIAIFGDATTKNAQGNGNTATADVDQSNSVDQSQSSKQKQSLEQSGGGKCCAGRSQTGEQKVYGGDQSVEKQRNDADVDQWQGNGNLNIAPAVAIFGDAETRSYQGNHNRADATVTQSNEATQSQDATQKQYLTQEAGECCKSSYGCRPTHQCAPKKEYGKKEHGRGKDSCCEHGPSQTGEQKADFGDQTVEKQRNEADVTQKQGNWNGSFAPAIGLGKGKGREHSCSSKCEKSGHSLGGNAETTNKQGNWNEATANVGQSNSADQSQASYQRQSLVEMCKGLVYR